MVYRSYGLIRSIIERHGGSINYVRRGYRYGAWVIEIGDTTKIIEAEGNQSFPELDRFYVPKIQDPKHYYDYYDQLIPEAEEQLLSWLGNSLVSESLPGDLEQIIKRTHWKFAWTYARTYPHEYTTKALCKPDDHAVLIDCIERYGIVERFGQSYRKYFYFQDRKYWHMGEPHSATRKSGRMSLTERGWMSGVMPQT